ncbi:MAG TPA: polysaccharide pyruvyl transferase family protein [Planctomycetes bacterium]|nr:polysaccharide pyruvyl transferase family protein [Planctomycetota bacterium]
MSVESNHSDPRVSVWVRSAQGGEELASFLGRARGEFLAVEVEGEAQDERRLEVQSRALDADPKLGAVFSRHRVRGKGRSGAMGREACRRAIARMALPAWPGTVMVRRAVVEELGWDGACGEAALFDLLLRLGERFGIEVLGEALVSVPAGSSWGARAEEVALACRRACERRGLDPDHGRWFEEAARRSLRVDVREECVAAAAESALAGRRAAALAMGLPGAGLALLPRVLLEGREHAARRAPATPLPVEGGQFAGAAPDPGPSLSRPPRLCLFGAAGDTGNLGVSALMHSTLAGLWRVAPETEMTVFDNGWGERDATARAGGREFFYRRIGARLSRRYHRPESFWNMHAAARTTDAFNPGLRAMRAADAILDISGGDSFADIYGDRHLEMILAPKRLALDLGRPLVLLPQTYGPFRTEASRAAAAEVLRGSRLAWARDERSFAAMQELLGDDFDAERHRVGVDVAFALERYRPRVELPVPIPDWLERKGDGAERPLVGINVSGLLWNDEAASSKYELRVDVRAFFLGLVRRFLERTEARIVLVSHVIPTEVLSESDPGAARELCSMLSEEEARRVVVLPEGLDQSETKWVISRLDWFTGARMHATIGAISSCVPTAGLAYSIKIRGVFASCDVEEDVVDLRSLDTGEALEATWRSFEDRDRAKRSLEASIPGVRRRALEELRETLVLITESIR